MIIFQIVGIVVIALLLVIIGLFILYALFRKDIRPLITEEEMPVLLPIPIPTKNRTFIMRVLVWLFDITQRYCRFMGNRRGRLYSDSRTI